MPEKQARSPIETDFRKRLPQEYRGQRREGRGEAIRDHADGAVRLLRLGAGCSFAAAVVRRVLARKSPDDTTSMFTPTRGATRTGGGSSQCR